MDLGLTGKVALVTGGGRGIGRAIARTLGAEGARVAVLGRNAEPLQATCAAIVEAGGMAIPLVADLGDIDALDRALAELTTAFGPPDIVVHNAAHFTAPRRLVAAMGPEWQASFAVNLAGVAHLSARAAVTMKQRRWGRMVFISSLLAGGGGRGYAIYVAMKSAQEGLARAIAVDFGPFGITANIVAPGFIETEHFLETAPLELRESHAQAAAVRRLGKPEEIAAAVAFLASEQAGFISGTTVPVGGGAQLNTRW